MEFKRLLFKTAFCCMACDGHIDQNEIDEMKRIDKNTAYFGDIDLSEELEKLIERLVKSGKKLVNELFQQLRETSLNPVQELLLLEVVLRIIHADKKVDENEIKFLKLLRGRLDVHDEIIVERFGKNILLFDKDYIDDVHVAQKDFISDLKIPDPTNFSTLTLNSEIKGNQTD